MLRLAAERHTPGPAALASAAAVMRQGGREVTELLETVAELRAPRAAWMEGAEKDESKGMTHLVLLYEEVVHVATTSEWPEVRSAAAKCLLLVGKELLKA